MRMSFVQFIGSIAERCNPPSALGDMWQLTTGRVLLPEKEQVFGALNTPTDRPAEQMESFEGFRDRLLDGQVNSINKRSHSIYDKNGKHTWKASPPLDLSLEERTLAWGCEREVTKIESWGMLTWLRTESNTSSTRQKREVLYLAVKENAPIEDWQERLTLTSAPATERMVHLTPSCLAS